MASVATYIRRRARQLGLDPEAVLAVASVEGGLRNREGDVGDLAGGGSYGPFQLYAQGKLPKRFRGNPRAADAWAWSPAGIDYALRRMVSAARGLRGQAAVDAIVRHFEVPANIEGEIAKAMSRYGGAHGSGPMGSPAGAGKVDLPEAGGPLDLTAWALSGLSRQGHNPERGLEDLVNAVAAGASAAPTPGGTPAPAPLGPRKSPRGGINELFYDPLGGVKYGHKIGAIGGHRDHVHFSLSTEAAQKAAIAYARRLGLHVGEDMDGNVHPVHVKDSFHYRRYRKGDPFRMAADVSGDASRMSAFYRWVSQTYGGR